MSGVWVQKIFQKRNMYFVTNFNFEFLKKDSTVITIIIKNVPAFLQKRTPIQNHNLPLAQSLAG